MDKNSYIGVFDSGIGGLTVAKEIMENLPNENIVYFGDTAHVPYGSRSKRQITQYVLSDVKFLSRFEIKAVVIACNTADSVAREAVEEAYPRLPVFGVVAPASRMAAEKSKNGRIGVIATKATVASKAYDRAIAAIAPEAVVLSKACPLLVPLVENGRFQPGDPVTQMVIREYLDHLVDLPNAVAIPLTDVPCPAYPYLISAEHPYNPDVPHFIRDFFAFIRSSADVRRLQEGIGK